MKTTIDIDDELLRQAKNLGKMTGRPLRSVVEEGLRNVLQANSRRPRYRLPDLSVGSESRPDPLEKYSWQELRDAIYGDDELR
ncbi:MAG: type II toxin-antitoxin system VapB family antitoxin [Chloroflexi bacterium]|nr:type II toxin-antitoxin system VapB family antitoxin [Chloroflexota bacterium]